MKTNSSTDQIKLLALDMDGTAYYSAGDIVPTNIEPIKQAMSQGIEIVFVTGRPIFSHQNRFAENNLVTPSTIVAGYNGAVIYRLEDKKVLHKAVIRNDLAHLLFRLAHDLGTKEVVVFGYVDDFDTVVLNRDKPETRNAKNLHDREMDFFDGKYKTYQPKLKYDFFKLLIFGGTKKLFDYLKKLGFSVATDDNTMAEINAPGVHKGSAIKWIADYYKIKPEEMMAIGDGPNDLPMMEQVGHSVSLANSIPALKAITKHQIDLTNEEGGVGYAIKHLILDKGTKETNEN